MNEIKSVSGKGVAVRGNHIDTDRIISTRFLRCVSFDGLPSRPFEDDRLQLKEAGKVHPFDDSVFAEGEILVSGSNFGCGSSRSTRPKSSCDGTRVSRRLRPSPLPKSFSAFFQ